MESANPKQIELGVLNSIFCHEIGTHVGFSDSMLDGNFPILMDHGY